MGGPWRNIPRRSPRNQTMCVGLEHLVGLCWLRPPPLHTAVSGGPSTAGRGDCPLRVNPSHRVHTEQETQRSLHNRASAMAELDLSWLVWSITGSDHEARLGGVGPDPVQVLAFRCA
eukprot:4054741-Pyramimonas_sp.AAC.1